MRARSAAFAVGFAAALLVSGCGRARPVDDGGIRQCVAWKQEIQPILAARCESCHSGKDPAGGYDTTSYATVLKDASGRTIATPGDPASTLLAAIDPATADATHAPFADTFPDLKEWVISCDASYLRSAIHDPGLMNPLDPQFHGTQVKNQGWSFTICQKCHGADLKGGPSGASCFACHKDGPTSCTGCHAEPPASGAHLQHVSGAELARPFDCVECHVKPQVYTDAGHLFAEDGAAIDRARITFGALAGQTLDGFPRKSAPGWDAASQRCSQVYCHGGPLVDANATNQQPTWATDPEQDKCGSCHGMPPSAPHPPIAQCSLCHGAVTDSTRMVIDRARHVDGKVSIADESGKCQGCHGGPDNPAPPRDAHGSSDPTMTSVGLHQNHLKAAAGLSAPVPCDACHVVPKQVNDPGHIDHDFPALVFPSVPAFAGRAIADGAPAAWDHASATCANVYCHGGGVAIGKDRSPTIVRTVKWTDSTARPRCGSCHGVPPVDAVKEHVGTDLGTCYKCHPTTVDSHGDILVSGPPGMTTSTHINGVVDVQK